MWEVTCPPPVFFFFGISALPSAVNGGQSLLVWLRSADGRVEKEASTRRKTTCGLSCVVPHLSLSLSLSLYVCVFIPPTKLQNLWNFVILKVLKSTRIFKDVVITICWGDPSLIINNLPMTIGPTRQGASNPRRPWGGAELVSQWMLP